MSYSQPSPYVTHALLRKEQAEHLAQLKKLSVGIQSAVNEHRDIVGLFRESLHALDEPLTP